MKSNKFLGKDAQSIATGVRRQLSFLNSLLECGEEPYEIESFVGEVRDAISAGLAPKAPFVPFGRVYEAVTAILEYTYLVRWSRRSNIGRLPGTWLRSFLESFTDGGKIFWPPYYQISLTQFYLLLFRYLEECGSLESKIDPLLKVLKLSEVTESSWVANTFTVEDIELKRLAELQ